MLYAKIGQQYADDFKTPAFKAAFDFLSRKDLKDLPVGKVELEHGVYASVQAYESKNKNEKKYEAHNRYYDVQFVISGEEYFYVCRRDDAEVDTPYNADKDCILYKDPAKETVLYLQAGDLVVVAPDEVHKPGCAAEVPGPVQKIVVKVPVEQ